MSTIVPGSQTEDAQIAYEERLSRNGRWALTEGTRYFSEKSEVHVTLARIAQRLEDLGIPYAVAGGMALFGHGFRRFTEDVDILVTQSGLKQLHAELEGRGYLPVFSGSKNLRDTQSGVRIEFLVSGQYPGDGRPKPVAFPDPDAASVRIDDISYLNLDSLVQLKLASGISNPLRIKDLGDVQQLILELRLPRELGDRLDPYVQSKFYELWDATVQVPTRYVRVWKIDPGVRTIDELITVSAEDAELLSRMKSDGVIMEWQDDLAVLVTSDASVARKYDMHDELEYLEGFGEH